MQSMWHIWQSAISTELCDQIVEMPKLELGHGGVGINEENTALNNEVRVSKISTFPFGSKEAKTINDMIYPFVVMANRENFGFRLNNFYELQYTEYYSNEAGFYGWHQDILWLQPNESQRKISVTVQLSDDDYEGGDFQFNEDIPQPSDIRSRGTVIVFPSFVYHQVTPVTRGTRKALVAWYEGECFV